MRAWILCAALAAAAGAEELRITAPAATDFVSGPVRLAAALEPALAAQVTRVTLFADGHAVCTRERPPWECQWDAGAEVKPRVIRAVAVLRDGRRVAASLRTRGDALMIGTEANLVLVTATVTDGSGRFVKGLAQKDFRVAEDGRPQEIAHFIGPGSAREVVAAVDMSGSMADAMGGLKEAVKGFLRTLRPEDSSTLIAFNDSLFTLARRETDPAARERAVDRLAPWGGTALYDALLRGMELLSKQKGRKALVVFTDGEDQSSLASVTQVERRLETSDAPVYVIGQGRGTDTPELQRIIRHISGLSGGRSFHTNRQDELEQAFAEIAEELSNQYLLAYDPTNAERDGSWRTITVTVPGYQVRARAGYRAVAPRAGRGGD